MLRFFAGAASAFLLVTGIFLIWQSRAEHAPILPSAPSGRATSASLFAASAPLDVPEASPKSREEKRFNRADKNKDGKIEASELFDPRRKAFAKLDTNGNGALSFEEWAVATIDKFKGADKDKSGWLTPAEYATTAPPAPKKKRCAC